MVVNVNSAFLAAPADAGLIGDGNENIQDTRMAFQERINLEHDCNLADQSRHGVHKQGSAMVEIYSGSTGTWPGTRKQTGVALGASDAGYLIYHVVDKTLYVYNGGTPSSSSSWYDLRKPQKIYVDNVYEFTAANGVNVDGVVIKDAGITASGTISGGSVLGAVWQS